MYAWFIKGQGPRAVMVKMFANSKCNLHQFWAAGHTQLHFRKVTDGSPLCPGPGTLVADTPFDSFLFPKDGPNAGKMQWEWKPLTIAIEGAGKAEGFAWMGVHVMLASKLTITVPKLRELHEQRIIQSTR